ncbi:MAG TPA: efflux RND transporter periplasmic adaptor subunit [Hyphomonadaceae bacterium]|nr:efflux RND transporter periplasmic adaptor subunit [Hyphomonadaceae bacterium]
MTRLPRTLIAAALLASAASLAACGGQPAAGASATAEKDPKTGKPMASASSVNTPYATISAGKVDVEGGLVDIAARSQGIVREVMVEEGDKVKTNEVLAKQEDDDSRLSRNRVAAQLAQAEAQIPTLQVDLAAAQREQARLASLIKENAIAQQTYDQANDRVKSLEAQLDAQQAAVKLVRAQLAEADYQVELHIIRSPADGTIVRRYANPGMGASTLNVTPMFQLQPDSQRIVRAEVEERSLNQVKVGQSVEIVPESDQEKSYPGKVLRIAGVMGARKLRSDDPSERADERVVEVVVDAEQAPVLIGQRVLVKFLKDDAKKSGEDTSKTAER